MRKLFLSVIRSVVDVISWIVPLPSSKQEKERREKGPGEFNACAKWVRKAIEHLCGLDVYVLSMVRFSSNSSESMIDVYPSDLTELKLSRKSLRPRGTETVRHLKTQDGWEPA
jgi:hypothetical protein